RSRVHAARDDLDRTPGFDDVDVGRVLAQDVAVAALERGARDHDAAAVPMLGERLAHQVQPGLSSLVVEWDPGRHPLDVLRRVEAVAVDERHVEALCEEAADRRLADALHAHHHDGHRLLRRHPQPFVAPAVSPETMYRCVKSAISMMGVVTTTDAAISAPQSIDAYPMKSKMATGSVFVAFPDSTSANMKLFQLKMNDRIVAVAMPGTDSGSVIRKNAPIAVRPSTCADSSSSSGS